MLRSHLIAAACAFAAFTAYPALAQTTFTNPSPISLPGTGTGGTTTGSAGIYPSAITVGGLSGTITGVTVTLTGVSHTFPDDLDILLVGPSGFATLLMSDAGGSVDLSNVTLVFSDSATNVPADTTTLTQTGAATLYPNSVFTTGGETGGTGVFTGGTATFRPSNYETAADVFLAPAPAGPYSANPLSGFNGLAPNGVYSLYIMDDAGGDAGSVAGGWSISINTSAVAVPEASAGLLALLAVPGLALVASRRRK